MDESEFTDVLWEIYLESCWCSMDHGSRCDCSAKDLAEHHLRGLLGDNWHEIMRQRHPR